MSAIAPAAPPPLLAGAGRTTGRCPYCTVDPLWISPTERDQHVRCCLAIHAGLETQRSRERAAARKRRQLGEEKR